MALAQTVFASVFGFVSITALTVLFLDIRKSLSNEGHPFRGPESEDDQSLIQRAEAEQLAYAAIILIICAAFLAVLPSFLMEAQFRMAFGTLLLVLSGAFAGIAQTKRRHRKNSRHSLQRGEGD